MTYNIESDLIIIYMHHDDHPVYTVRTWPQPMTM